MFKQEISSHLSLQPIEALRIVPKEKPINKCVKLPFGFTNHDNELDISHVIQNL